jgi:hypothetical protein
MYAHKGCCHCGAIEIELRTDRPPQEQIIGACQCSFCRKHNARTFSDPKASATLAAKEPRFLQRYTFGLHTAESIVCGRCGVYVAMVLLGAGRAWSTINIDTLDDRVLFSRHPEARDFGAEDCAGRTERRKARWIPTTLIGWPE